MKFTDAAEITGPRTTRDGYLTASVRCARTGCQDYLGVEVGRPDLARVTVYRPESAVFNRDSLSTFVGKPVTVGHPNVPVTAENWKDHAVGSVGEDVIRDGEFVRVSLAMMDSAAIAAVKSGHREISMGYESSLTFEDGIAPDGTPYQAVMGDLRMNHLAAVPRARGGSELRIGDGADSEARASNWGAAPLTTDATHKEGQMAELRKVMVDGLQVETTDAGAQAIEKLTKDKDALAAKLTDAETKHADAIKAKDAEIAKKDAEIDDAKSKILSDSDIDKRVQDRGDLVALAGAIAKDVKTTGVSDADIRKAVVVAKLGDAAVEGKSAAYVDARFDILAEDAKKGTDPVARALADGKPAPVTDNGQSAYEARLGDAWKGAK